MRHKRSWNWSANPDGPYAWLRRPRILRCCARRHGPRVLREAVLKPASQRSGLSSEVEQTILIGSVRIVELPLKQKGHSPCCRNRNKLAALEDFQIAARQALEADL